MSSANSPDLTGKVVVVTGSTSGIGRGIARACGRAGARVVVSSRRPEAVESVVTEFRVDGIDATGTAVDVTDAGSLEALLAHAVESFGGVDVWVNNAGISGGMSPLDEMSAEALEAIVATNVTGVMLGCRMMVAYFTEHGGGVILNLAGRGSDGRAAAFGAPYAATKAAVTSLTKSLAAENEDLPVSIHQIMPGMVRTSFFEDLRVSPSLAQGAADNMEIVLDAIGVPVEEVGAMVARVAAQEPGRVTGKTYSAFRGMRRLRGIAKLSWYGMTGKMKPVRRAR